MSRRVRRPLKSRTSGDRPKGAPPYRGSQAERAHGHRPGGKHTAGKQPARVTASRAKPQPFTPEPVEAAPEPPPLPFQQYNPYHSSGLLLTDVHFNL